MNCDFTKAPKAPQEEIETVKEMLEAMTEDRTCAVLSALAQRAFINFVKVNFDTQHLQGWSEALCENIDFSLKTFQESPLGQIPGEVGGPVNEFEYKIFATADDDNYTVINVNYTIQGKPYDQVLSLNILLEEILCGDEEEDSVRIY